MKLDFKNRMGENVCGECGAILRSALEFHPVAFCEMKKRGLWPWVEMHKQHPGRLPSRPPLVTDRTPAHVDSLMAMAAHTEKATRPATDEAENG